MNYMSEYLSGEFVRAMGWTIVHSLWQGAVVALLLGIIMVVLNKHSANVRYFLSAAALITVVLLAGVTFIIHYQPNSTREEVSLNAPLTNGEATVSQITHSEQHAAAEFGVTITRYFNDHLPLIVMVWLLGFLILSLRLLGGLALTQRLRHYRTYTLPAEWQQKVNELSRKLGITHAVSIVESALTGVPMVIGHLKPVILFPLGTISGLSVQQVEAILAHELAHIYRNDYLVNIIQSVIETIFFYHPAVWWISANIRTERENSCDDIAVALSTDSMTLATALADLEKINSSANPRLAMAATGRNGKLYNRINRLVYSPKNNPTFKEGFIAACVLVSGIFLMSFQSTYSKTSFTEDRRNTTISDVSQISKSVAQDMGVEALENHSALTNRDENEAESKHDKEEEQVEKDREEIVSGLERLDKYPEQSVAHEDQPPPTEAQDGKDGKVLSTVLDDGTYLFVRFDEKEKIIELFVNGREVKGKEKVKYEKIAFEELQKLKDRETKFQAQEQLLRARELSMMQMQEAMQQQQYMEHEVQERQAQLQMELQKTILEQQEMLRMDELLLSEQRIAVPSRMLQELEKQQALAKLELVKQQELMARLEQESTNLEERTHMQEDMAKRYQQILMDYERMIIDKMDDMHQNMERIIQDQERELREELVKDGLIEKTEELHLNRKKSGEIFVNDKKLEGGLHTKYDNLLKGNQKILQNMEKEMMRAIEDYNQKRAQDLIQFKKKMNKKYME